MNITLTGESRDIPDILHENSRYELHNTKKKLLKRHKIPQFRVAQPIIKKQKKLNLKDEARKRPNHHKAVDPKNKQPKKNDTAGTDNQDKADPDN